MDSRTALVIVGLSLTVSVSGASAGQHEEHQGAATTGGEAQASPEFLQCRQVQPGITAALEAALKRLDEARQTNSAAVMRAAADDLQRLLLDVREQLASCAAMQLAAAGPQTGHVMPNMPQAPAATPTAPAPTGIEPHTGHVAPSPAAPTAPRAGQVTPPTHQHPETPPSRDARPSERTQETAALGVHADHAPPNPAAPPPTRATPATSLATLNCRIPVDAKTAPRMLYQGRMYYFCSAEERAEFAKDPAKYVTQPPAAPSHAH